MRVPRLRRSWRLVTLSSALALVALASVAMTVAVSGDASERGSSPQSGRATQSIWESAVAPSVPAAADDRSVQLGVRFESSVDGDVVGLRFYKSSASSGPFTGNLWSADGSALAQVSFASTDAAGWQQAQLAPVAIVAGRQYVASYRAPHGHYAADQWTLGAGRPVRSGQLTALSGVYSYGEEMPSHTWNNTNYYVDVVFVPHTDDAQPGNESAAGAVGPATASPKIRDVDGGSTFYDRFTNGLPSTADFFPIGVWFESVTQPEDAATDHAAGLNTYVELTANTDPSLIEAAGMHAIWGSRPDSKAVAGYLTSDEVDMWGGPGSAEWTGHYPGQGDVCSPADSRCGYSVMEKVVQAAAPTQMKFTNYGKGVTFWESDDEAGRFVNEYQDVVSADNYWFTDPAICDASQGGALVGDGSPLPESECRLAANYGATVDRVRGLVEPAGSKPVWTFVEVGHPSSEPSAPTITGPEIRAAVWSGLIHGARGVIYFNHSFGGSCLSQHVLRDQCGAGVRSDVTSLNQQIMRLAPVLNAPFVDDYVTAKGAVDVAAKILDGSMYILSGSRQDGPGTVDFKVACGDATEATVVDEDRSIPVKNGAFIDRFDDGNSVHIYELPDTSCNFVR